MRLKKYLNEAVQQQFATEDDFVKWVSQFPKSGRSPKGKKKEFSNLQFLILQADMYKKYGMMSWDNVNATLAYTSKEEFENLFAKDRTEELKMGKITYINTSPLAEKSFIDKAKAINKLLKSLKGYHKKVISKPLTIIFKSKDQIGVKGKYKTDVDQVWIKHNANIKNDDYASLLYIIVHELGHRWQKFYGLPNKWKNTYTTPYSKKETLADSEAFSELFALSHWPKKYPKFKDQIEWFNGVMK